MIDVGILEVRHPDGQVFEFEPGSLAVAYSLTGHGPADDAYARFQTLFRPQDLAQWSVEMIGVQAEATGEDLETALRLQAVVWRAVDAVIDQRRIDDVDRAFLNTLAAEPCLVPRLVEGARRAWVDPAGARSVLSSVARDAIDLVGGARAARLKRCQGSRCALVFVDVSRSGRRRWCSMDRCGNRTKVAAHRQRMKERTI